MRKFPIWDLSNRFGSFGIVNATARLFLARSDGGFDYFPRGIRKPGYQIDAQIRDQIMEQAGQHRDAMRPLWITCLCLAVALFFVAMSEIPVPTDETPSLPVAVWWEFAVGGVFLALALAIGRRYRDRAMALVKGAPIVNMPEEEYRELVVRRWKEAKRQSLAMYLVIFINFFTTRHAFTTEFQWMHIVITSVLVVAILQRAVETITVWRWSRAGIGGYSDNISRR
jgi:hypothetical protein